MKKGMLLFMIIGILFSCTKNDDGITETELFGNWKLIQMAGSIPNSGTTGSEMEWQETYILKSDGTFQKSRERNGVLMEVYGTYSVFNTAKGQFLELFYTSENEIIGSCYSKNLKEVMSIQSENTFSSTWEACDGPGLLYKKAD